MGASKKKIAEYIELLVNSRKMKLQDAIDKRFYYVDNNTATTTLEQSTITPEPIGQSLTEHEIAVLEAARVPGPSLINKQTNAPQTDSSKEGTSQ